MRRRPPSWRCCRRRSSSTAPRQGLRAGLCRAAGAGCTRRGVSSVHCGPAPRLYASGDRRGDEVIVPAETHVATARRRGNHGRQAGLCRLRPHHRQYRSGSARPRRVAAHESDQRGSFPRPACGYGGGDEDCPGAWHLRRRGLRAGRGRLHRWQGLRACGAMLAFSPSIPSST